MKFNFRKIASVLTGAVMLSSTVALAAAASFSANQSPFITGGAANYAVVYGSASVAGTDQVAATNINTFLQGKVTTTETPTTTTTTTDVTDGDVAQLAKLKDNFNFGDSADDFQSPLDAEDLDVLLADGVYYNDANDDFEYEQEIEMGSWSLAWNQNDRYNSEKPFAGVEFSNGDSVLNYTLDFKTDAEGGTAFVNLESTVIKMMGRDYYISEADTTANGLQLTLLDTANSVRIAEGETATVTIGDKSYAIKVASISDGTTDSVSLEVNGVEITTELEEGDTAKVRGENTYVGVKKISTSSKESVANTAVITIGTGQLVLEDGQEVELNGDPLSDTYENYLVKSHFTNASTDLGTITLEWKVAKDNKVFLSPGASITMPGFESVKVSMGDMVIPEGEETTIQDGSDTAEVTTTLVDGEVTFDILYQDTNNTGFMGLGSDEDEQLVTVGMNADNYTENDWVGVGAGEQLALNLSLTGGNHFFVTWIDGDDAETQYYEFTSIGSDNETVITNLANDDTITLSEVGDEDESTEVTIELLDANDDDEWVILGLSTTSSTANVYTDRVVTKGGLQFTLPTDGTVNTFDMVFNETDADSGGIALGSEFTVTLGASEDGSEPTGVSGLNTYPQEEDSDVEIGYVQSDLATYVEWNDAEDAAGDIKVVAHPSEVYGKVYVAEGSATVGSSSGGGSAGTLVVTDSQVSTVSGKNLIVVGGSCVNTVAAKLLGSDTPLCGADWTAKTNVGAGAFLIQTFASPYTEGKIATLVAGYEAADTTNAANALKTDTTVETTVGKKYVKLAGSTLQLA